jgi:hypothetical protein
MKKLKYEGFKQVKNNSGTDNFWNWLFNGVLENRSTKMQLQNLINNDYYVYCEHFDYNSLPEGGVLG